jgi:hypothetical protein
MVEQDVEKVLADIRAQVIGAAVAEQPAAVRTNGGHVPATRFKSEPLPVRNGYASLTVLARAWDRLPPLVSNRTGGSARLELWIKAKLKRALKWITWEQVNFNAATHHTFQEIIESLNAYEQRLVNFQNELSAEAEATRTQLELRQEKIDSQGEELKQLWAEIKNRDEQLETLRKQLKKQQQDLDAQRVDVNARGVELETQQADLSGQRALLNGQKAELDQKIESLNLLVKEIATQFSSQLTDFAGEQLTNTERRFAQLLTEFRERDERLLDEQRVCFKQLSLELTESQVLQDRVRRELEVRLEKLEK